MLVIYIVFDQFDLGHSEVGYELGQHLLARNGCSKLEFRRTGDDN